MVARKAAWLTKTTFTKWYEVTLDVLRSCVKDNAREASCVDESIT